jgi:hypothetical protein
MCLVCRFNKDFDALVKQKHTDADRLSDLNTRVDELIRELVKIHLVLNPAAVADTAADADAAAPPEGRSSTAGAADGASAGLETGAAAADGRGDVVSAVQLSAELAAGRLVPYWGPEENLEDMLLKVQPGEVKVGPTMDYPVGFSDATIAKTVHMLLAATQQTSASCRQLCHFCSTCCFVRLTTCW